MSEPQPTAAATFDLEQSGATQSEFRYELRRIFHYFRTNFWPRLGLLLVLSMFALAIFAPWIATHDPIKPDMTSFLLPPSFEHYFGTDNSGFDIFSRVVFGTRVDVFIGFTAVFLGFLIGVPLGSAVGYFRGLWTEAIMRVNDFIQSFPVFILAMAIVSVTGPRTENIIGVIAFLNIAVFVRLMRGEVLSLREHEYIEAARCAGSSSVRIVFEHLLPNAIGPSLVIASANIGFAILLTAGLSFIGAGVRTPTPEWGLMVSTGARNMILGEWWPAFFPGIAIGVAVLGFALLGEGIKDLIDPTKRK